MKRIVIEFDPREKSFKAVKANSFKGNAMALALRSFGINPARTKKSWPRQKGPAGVRIDVTTGTAVSFVV